MGLLDEINGIVDAIRGSLNAAAEGLGDWAGSDAGQQVLVALDFISISSQLGDYYAHVGWYFPVHGELHRYILEHREYHIPFDARAAADLIGPGSAHWDWIVEGVRASPSAQGRLPLIEDGVYCLEHGRWHAAVCSLLPVIEGLVSDRAGVLSGERVGRRFKRVLHQEGGDWQTISAVPALSVLDAEIFEGREFAGVAVAETALNRHLVLHGRTVGFGTKVNGCRAFMLLVALVELLDGALLLRTTSAPADTVAYLNEYGPLAELRQAARRAREAKLQQP